MEANTLKTKRKKEKKRKSTAFLYEFLYHQYQYSFLYKRIKVIRSHLALTFFFKKKSTPSSYLFKSKKIERMTFHSIPFS